ncbi:AAA family ATPase [Methylobacterium crusticola]|uniref:AAA family ATPase n=1 Tax=Methylobacterium crusticola TaxID=1697972 RepID=UPI000FFBAE57
MSRCLGVEASRQVDVEMRTLSVVSQKGGSGRTTLSVNLAVAAERAGLSCAIVDLDPQASGWKWSQRRKSEAPEVITAVAEQLESIQTKAAEGGLDLLIIDSAPHADRAALLACKVADLILIPTRASILDLDALKPVLELVEMARRPALGVLNGVSTQTSLDVEEARDAIKARGVELHAAYIHERVIYKRSLIDGRTVIEAGSDAKAIREIGGLFAAVVERMGLEIPAGEVAA